MSHWYWWLLSYLQISLNGSCLSFLKDITFWLSLNLCCRVSLGKCGHCQKMIDKTVYTLYGEDVRHILFTLSMYLYRQYALPLSIPLLRCGSQRGVFSCAFTIWTTLWIWKFLNVIYTFTRYTILCALLRANFSDLLVNGLPAGIFIQVSDGRFISWLSDITIG